MHVTGPRLRRAAATPLFGWGTCELCRRRGGMRAQGRALSSQTAATAGSVHGLDRFPMTLILNADYTPLSFSPLSTLNWRDCLRCVYLEKVTVVSTYEDLVLRSINLVVPLPSVVALRRYQNIPLRKPVLTRRNILLRDGFKCSYCGGSFSSEQLTLDHVTPRSKGGLSDWSNITSCCHACNQRKGSTSLIDLRPIGMRLINPPKIPSLYDLQARRKGGSISPEHDLHPHWKAFTFSE